MNDFRTQASRVLDQLDQIAQRELHSDRLKKAIDEDAKKHLDMQDELKKLEKEIETAKKTGNELISKAKKDASDILELAKKKDAEASEHLEEAKTAHKIASSKEEAAENARLAATNALNDLQAQKERIQAVLR